MVGVTIACPFSVSPAELVLFPGVSSLTDGWHHFPLLGLQVDPLRSLHPRLYTCIYQDVSIHLLQAFHLNPFSLPSPLPGLPHSLASLCCPVKI